MVGGGGGEPWEKKVILKYREYPVIIHSFSFDSFGEMKWEKEALVVVVGR